MRRIHVCPLSQLEVTLAASRARWMISLMGPGKTKPQPGQISGGFSGLEFNDIAEEREGLVAPKEIHVKEILSLVESWKQAGRNGGDLLIHCWMGISRSTAAMLIAQAYLNPLSDMGNLATKLRTASPMATPNPLMISIADSLLNLNGQLVTAVQSIGRGEDAFEGAPFAMEVIE